MPETPDFESIAQRLLAEVLDPADPQKPKNIVAIAEQLRLVWNARGAADIAKMEVTLYADGTSRTGFDKMLDHALRSLDR
jgi:hypothetical protein